MQPKKKMLAIAVALASVPAAHAQTNAPTPAAEGRMLLAPVVVTANPLGSDLFELVPPISVLDGPELMLRRRQTLGETLDGLPGVHGTYFGPNASRPMIRGFDADRIRI